MTLAEGVALHMCYLCCTLPGQEKKLSPHKSNVSVNLSNSDMTERRGLEKQFSAVFT